jgi:AraC family transcriptional regulator, positive regulator of tynA and feaB
MRNGTVSFSTNTVAAPRRLAYWNDLASAAFGPLAVDPTEPDRFQARLTRVPLGSSFVASACSSPATIRCHGEKSPDAMGRAVNLALQRRGVSRRTQLGNVVELSPGDLVLVDCCRPHIVEFDRPSETLVVRLPLTTVLERVGDPERYFGMRVAGSSAAGALLASFILTTFANLPNLTSADATSTVTDVLLSLLELVYGRPRQPKNGGPSGTAGDHLQRAQQYVEAHLCDPEFSARDIAEELGLGPRYLQILFATMNVTPTVYILNRRLDIAAKRLRHGREWRQISQVAFSVGFSDLSYFSHAFRRRFGMSARCYRDLAIAPASSVSETPFPGGEFTTI